MTQPPRRTILVAVIALVAAFAGVVIGRALTAPAAKPLNAIHDVVHDDLDLTAEQTARITRLEARFALRRQALEWELRAANARLAASLQREQAFGPGVAADLDRAQQAMGQLQKETIGHVFAMRAVLTPRQADEFDRAVTKALTADAR